MNGFRAVTVAARAALAVLLCLAPARGEAAESAFTVSQVQVFLSAKAKSQVVTVRNVSPTALRFQLNVFAWDQTPEGEMILAPTTDIVFFPPLFALAPGEERNVRIGAATPPSATGEKTYRLFIEELPGPEGAPAGGSPGQVTIRTRLGLPIFLEPPKAAVGGRIEALAVRDGRVAFEVRNTGNVHFVTQAVRIDGYGAGGDPVVQGALEGWYVLPGGKRIYDVALPPDKCPAVKVVSVEVHTAQAVFAERLDVPPAACRR